MPGFGVFIQMYQPSPLSDNGKEAIRRRKIPLGTHNYESFFSNFSSQTSSKDCPCSTSVFQTLVLLSFRRLCDFSPPQYIESGETACFDKLNMAPKSTQQPHPEMREQKWCCASQPADLFWLLVSHESLLLSAEGRTETTQRKRSSSVQHSDITVAIFNQPTPVSVLTDHIHKTQPGHTV